MNKPEYLLENEMLNFLLDFEKQTDYPFQSRRPGPVLIKKKKRTFHQVDFAMPAGPFQRTRKIAEHESDSDTIYRWSSRNSHQKLEKEIRGRNGIIQTTALLKLAMIFRRVREN